MKTTNQSSGKKNSVKDRVRLPFFFDTEKMIKEYEDLGLGPFTYYSAVPLRGPAHIVDPSLPMPPPSDNYADGSWTDWLDTPILKESPYLKSVIDTFADNAQVTLVRLLRLAAGSTVKEHTDPTLGLHIAKSVIRLTVPIISKKDVTFYLNGTAVPMLPGECWYMRLTDPHKVVNAGPTERVNLTIDLQPNKWVRALVAEAEKADAVPIG
ncbi:MAG: aspartyl/asparaginyl beta-hydroxylase domain-containing protein [Cytophagales bacterium]|nr:aspartyl/asparaginyl beta-hydroxylase domain-containing protein [Cytophagales bacterium]